MTSINTQTQLSPQEIIYCPSGPFLPNYGDLKKSGNPQPVHFPSMVLTWYIVW